MFSRRTPEDLTPNPLAHLRTELGAGLIDLTVTNPTRVGLPLPLDAVDAAFARAAGAARSYDPDPQGRRVAREAVCAYYEDAHGVRVHPDDVFLTASTSEAYAFLFKLLADPGEALLVPTPSYPLFDHLLALEGLRGLPYPLYYVDGWMLDRQALSDALPGARGVISVSPNNPTGSSLSFDEWAFLEAALSRRGLSLISDEVFADHPLGPGPRRSPSTLAGREAGPLTFSLGGLSKLLALPQLKLSWIVLSGDAQLRAEARRRLEIIADSYLSVSAGVQAALPELMGLREGIVSAVVGRTQVNLTRLVEACAPPSPCSVLAADGGWAAVLRIPRIMDADEAVEDLARHGGVWVQPGYFFDLSPGHLVLSLIGSPDAFTSGVHALTQRVRRWDSL